MRRHHIASLVSLLGLAGSRRGPCHVRFGSEPLAAPSTLAALDARVTAVEGDTSNNADSIGDLQNIITETGVPIKLAATSSTGSGSSQTHDLTITGSPETNAHYIVKGRAIVRDRSDDRVVLVRTFLGTEVSRGSSSWARVAKGPHVDSDVDADVADILSDAVADGPDLGDNSNALALFIEVVNSAIYSVDFHGTIARSKAAS